MAAGGVQVTALEPCPFCQSPDSAKPFKDNRKLWAVRCSCGLHGTWNTRRYGAVEAWNDRSRLHFRLAAAPPGAAIGGEEERLREALRLARDTLHECTAVLTASDCAKVSAVMAQCRAVLDAVKDAYRAGWIARSDYGTDRADYAEMIDDEFSTIAALTSPAADTSADVGVAPDGMVSWAGGERAPDDWGGGTVLFRDGTVADLYSEGWDWSHVPTDPPHVRAVEIIAYTPLPTLSSELGK